MATNGFRFAAKYEAHQVPCAKTKEIEKQFTNFNILPNYDFFFFSFFFGFVCFVDVNSCGYW